MTYNDYDCDDEDPLDFQEDNRPLRYAIFRYLPKKVLINREGSRYIRRGFWKQFPDLYTSKQVDAICGLYYQWGDIIKVKRAR